MRGVSHPGVYPIHVIADCDTNRRLSAEQVAQPFRQPDAVSPCKSIACVPLRGTTEVACMLPQRDKVGCFSAGRPASIAAR